MRLLASAALLLVTSCTQRVQTAAPAQTAVAPSANQTVAAVLPASDPLEGDVAPVHDPSLAKTPDGTWISWTTDLPFLHASPKLAQRCSADLKQWQSCGYVFPGLPAWVQQKYPEAAGLWAPDISFFGGKYHLYYAVSTLGSQHSAIGMALSSTLDPADWQDQGLVLTSEPGADFNAIDPNVLVDADGRVWLSYGSFWSGIFQQEVDPATGKPLSGAPRYHLAAQPLSRNGAIEGAALASHNGWYYLFASIGVCCAIPIENDTYQQIVGRSRSIHGPFMAEDGANMLNGGGTVLLTSDANWLAPGGGSLWQSADQSETLLAFHALRRAENGALYLWVQRVGWKDDWPVLGPL